jgi:hypothetical protein
MTRSVLLAATAAALAGCGGGNTESNVAVPGAAPTLETRALEAGADVLQAAPPIGALNAYLDGFHFYSGRMESQVEAHHYCAIVNEDVIQCVIYDGNTSDAKLMGLEYIVSGRLFASLPEPEKALWHSHVHEVASGQLIAPGIPQAAEHELMEKLIGTYGKTWHTWHTDPQQGLPLGVPQLMMGFTEDGQLDDARLADRNRRFDIDGEDVRRDRASIEVPEVLPGADAWRDGNVVQIEDPIREPAGDAAQPGTEAAGAD